MSKWSTALAAHSPLSWLRLDDTSGTTAVASAGSNGTYVNTPTLGVASLLPADSNKAVSLERASSERITVPDGASSDISDASFTVGCWVKPASQPTSGQFFTIVAKTNESGSTVSYTIDYRNESGTIKLASELKTSGGLTTLKGTKTLTTGTAYFVALVYDGANMYLYVDSVELAKTAKTGNVTANNEVLAWGAYNNVDHWNGTIDEAFLLPGALSAVQIKALYESASESEGTKYEDSGSGTVTVSGSGTESYAHNDSGSGTITESGSGKESYAHNDSGSGTVTLSGSGKDSFAHNDSGSGTITLSGSGTGADSHTESGSGIVTFSGSGTELYSHTDSGSGTVTTSGSGKESITYTGSGTCIVTLSGSGSESWAHTDAGSGTVTLSGTGKEFFSTEFVDAGTGIITISGSGTDSASDSDARSGEITISGTGKESISHFGSSEGTIMLGGEGEEALGFGYADSGSGAITLVGEGEELLQTVFVDSGSGVVVMVGSGKDHHEHARRFLADPPSELVLSPYATTLTFAPNKTTAELAANVTTQALHSPSTSLALKPSNVSLDLDPAETEQALAPNSSTLKLDNG